MKTHLELAQFFKQIDTAVEAKWKTGVYGVAKWLVIGVVTAIIGATVRMVIGG